MDPRVEWSFGKDSDLIVEVWSTAATIAAVIEALLEDPDKMALALRTISGSLPDGGRAEPAFG